MKNSPKNLITFASEIALVAALSMPLALPVQAATDPCMKEEPTGEGAKFVRALGGLFNSPKMKKWAVQQDIGWCNAKRKNQVLRVLDENAFEIATFAVGSALVCGKFCEVTFKLILDGASVTVPVTKAQAAMLASATAVLVYSAEENKAEVVDE